MNIRTTVCMGVATAALLVAGSASAQSVKIENAVARVIYVVEDRRDIAIEVSNETGATPELRMSRSGDDITIRGNIGGRRNTIRINECHSGRSRAPQSSPGEGASVTIEGRRVALSDAPMIVVRGPRTVKISTTGAVFGSIGRGAQSVELGSGGCGDWVVANVSGASDISIGGSGQVWSGSSQRLKVAIGGSGDVRAGRVEALEVAIGGSGDVSVTGGRVSDLSAQIVGSGDVDIATTVQDASVGIMGSGDVRIQRVTGNVSKRIAGSGEVRIAQQS